MKVAWKAGRAFTKLFFALLLFVTNSLLSRRMRSQSFSRIFPLIHYRHSLFHVFHIVDPIGWSQTMQITWANAKERIRTFSQKVISSDQVGHATNRRKKNVLYQTGRAFSPRWERKWDWTPRRNERYSVSGHFFLLGSARAHAKRIASPPPPPPPFNPLITFVPILGKELPTTFDHCTPGTEFEPLPTVSTLWRFETLDTLCSRFKWPCCVQNFPRSKH